MRLLLCSLFFTACNKPFETKDAVLLRICNNSNTTFDSVFVNSPGGKQRYHNIAAASASEYKLFNFLYNYAYIEVHYNNQLLRLQPIDYAGEEKLKNGSYSYYIGIAAGNPGSLTLTCLKD